MRWTVLAVARWVGPALGAASWSEHVLAGIDKAGLEQRRASLLGSRLILEIDVDETSAMLALGRVSDALDDTGPATIVKQLSATDSADPSSAQIAPLVGLAEAATILKLKRPRVSQLARTASFPSPAAQLASGPVWTRASIEYWASRRRGEG